MAALIVASMAMMTVFAEDVTSVSISLRTNQSVARAGHTTDMNKSCEFTAKNNSSSKHRVWLIPKYCKVGGIWHDYDTKQKLLAVGAGISEGNLKISNPKDPQAVHWSVELKVFASMKNCTATAKATLK